MGNCKLYNMTLNNNYREKEYKDTEKESKQIQTNGDMQKEKQTETH